MTRLPVRWRLTLAFGAVMAVVLAATGAFVHQRLASSLDGAIESTLRARAADVAALARQSDSGLREAGGRRASQHRIEFAQLIAGANRVLDRTPGLSPAPLLAEDDLTAARRGRPVVTDVVLEGDEPVRLSAEAVRAQDQTLVVVVGQSLEARNRALGDLGGVLLLGGPVALVLASLAGYLLTGAALRPVEAMRRRAATISATNLDGRLPPAGGNDELGRLERTLNDMLARVQASVVRERTFVSDASHELRSPLAMLRTELELIARDQPAGRALGRAVGSAIEETDRLTQLADDLLLLTRDDENRLVIEPTRVRAAELLHAAAARARRRGPPTNVEITVDAPADDFVLADDNRVAQALDNLLANALRYADTRVDLTARNRETSVELHVLDDGAGFPPDFLSEAWKRFARADAGRTEDGAGLGLAIVRTIAELHGGNAHAENRPGGGADVWISLPGGPRSRSPTPPAASAPPPVSSPPRR